MTGADVASPKLDTSRIPCWISNMMHLYLLLGSCYRSISSTSTNLQNSLLDFSYQPYLFPRLIRSQSHISHSVSIRSEHAELLFRNIWQQLTVIPFMWVTVNCHPPNTSSSLCLISKRRVSVDGMTNGSLHAKDFMRNRTDDKHMIKMALIPPLARRSAGLWGVAWKKPV